MHHRHKIDAPSGTALALGEGLARGRGVNLEDVKQAVRDGHTGERKAGEIGFATLRGGDVAGEHEAAAAEGERVLLGHEASAAFAAGAIRAALWPCWVNRRAFITCGMYWVLKLTRRPTSSM